MKYPFWPDVKGFRDIEFGLERVLELSKRLGDIHLKLPPVIHVAGTNGKGSTLAFLQAIFNENNLKTNKYTSPHLINFNERIILNNKEISDEFLTYCLKECRKMANKKPKIDVTFFEGVTIAAFLAFLIEKSDILLLETGMGGILDATNIVPQILAAIITPISFDHQDFLGNNIVDIAKNKAGIIKQNCPVITFQNYQAAFNIIHNESVAKNSDFYYINDNQVAIDKNILKSNEFNIIDNQNNWHLQNSDINLKFHRPNLIGNFQLINAALAIIASIKQKEFNISLNSFNKAIIKADWPGRMQEIQHGKLHNLLSNKSKLFIDGGHNEMAAINIAKFVNSFKSKNKIAIIAMIKDKDSNAFIKSIASEFDLIICSEIKDKNYILSCSNLKNIGQKYHKNIIEISDIKKALSHIKIKYGNQDNLVMICGSLYLIGDFLEENNVN